MNVVLFPSEALKMKSYVLSHIAGASMPPSIWKVYLHQFPHHNSNIAMAFHFQPPPRLLYKLTMAVNCCSLSLTLFSCADK